MTNHDFWLTNHKTDTIDNSAANLKPPVHLAKDTEGRSSISLQKNNVYTKKDTNLTDSVTLNIQRDFVAKINLGDTSNLSVIHLKVGTKPGSNDIADLSFVYGDHVNVPPTTTYLQKGNTIYIGFHDMTSKFPSAKKYCNISIEKKNGKLFSYDSIINQ